MQVTVVEHTSQLSGQAMVVVVVAVPLKGLSGIPPYTSDIVHSSLLQTMKSELVCSVGSHTKWSEQAWCVVLYVKDKQEARESHSLLQEVTELAPTCWPPGM
jgi:hypothetical protein